MNGETLTGRQADAGTVSAMNRATLSMGIGTTLSRVTGLLRVFALAYALGFTSLADSYNLANTIPNILHDIVLGGILTAVFVPVFIERMETSPATATEDISAVLSTSLVVVALATALFLAFAPGIAHVFDHFAAGGTGRSRLDVTITLLRLFAPQLAAYGTFSIATAYLNSHRRFALPAFAPAVNNLVLIGVLMAFGVAAKHPTPAWVADHHGLLILLGAGTTVGVVLQALVLVPSLYRLAPELRWNFAFRHPAVRRVVRLGLWTLGFVVGSQLTLLVVLAVALHLGTGDVAAYTYAYTFFQFPFGIVVVSVMSTTIPELSSTWFTGRTGSFRRYYTTGLVRILALVLPAAGGELVIAHQAIALLLGHGAGNFSSSSLTGEALALLAVGLPGFSVFMYTMAAFQSMQRMKAVFWIYLLKNGLNLVLALLLSATLGFRGLILSISIAYDLTALLSVWYFQRSTGGVSSALLRHLWRLCIATACLAGAAAAGVSISASTSSAGLLARVCTAVGAGLVAYVATIVATGYLQERRRKRLHAARAAGGG